MNLLNYATKSVDEVSGELGTSSTQGLTKANASQILKKVGPNEIKAQEVHWWNILIDQWRSPFIYLLCGAAIVAFLVTKDYFEGSMILVIVGINTFLGFYQEYKASQALALLKKYIVSYSKVIRDGQQQIVVSSQLVPGDLIVLEPGDVVPADIRLVSDQSPMVDESMLTGESVPVNKTSQKLEQEPHGLYQAQNLCFAGTTLISGKASGIVIATGAQTSIGDITRLMAQAVRESVFARGIERFSSFILRFVILTIVFVFLANVIVKGKSLFDADLLIFSVALAVTIIPEMLPTVTTFSLASGALRLAQHKVVVKRLTAIEDLGSIQILCTDKTGTLTENELVVADVLSNDPPNALFYATVMAESYLSLKNKKHAAFAFDQALWNKLPEDKKAEVKNYQYVSEVPFEPERRRSSTVVKKGDTYILVVRGAYEEILKTSHNITPELHDSIVKWIADQGKEGRRVIAVAIKEINQSELTDLKAAEKDLTYLGTISFVDPIKKTTAKAIKEAQILGVKIKILTGDSPEVAAAVAQKVKLIKEPQDVMTGEAFAAMSEHDKSKAAMHYAVFARIAPQQKYEIIEALQKHYEVGYLGDGINDAPALKLANVAICVQGSADVAQEAADIVLLKKSLYVLIDGIEEGRKIFANTIKYIKTTIFSNIGHFYSIAIASLLLDYFPILPLQLLLLNIITDFPMIAIATDNVDLDQLQSPRLYNIRDIALFSLVLSPISTIFDFVIFAFFHNESPAVLQTNWFIGAVITELLIILLLRTNKPFFKAKAPSWPLLIIILGGCAVTLALPYTSIGQSFFNFVPPTVEELKLVGIAMIGYFIATECAKLLYYHMMNRTHPKPRILK